MTEKELEILFRKKFDERQVEFNPAAWEGAERLIVEGEKRARRRVVMGWSAAASVALVLGLTSWSVINTQQYEPMDGPAIAWPTQNLMDESTINAIADESNTTEFPTAAPAADETYGISSATNDQSDEVEFEVQESNNGQTTEVIEVVEQDEVSVSSTVAAESDASSENIAGTTDESFESLAGSQPDLQEIVEVQPSKTTSESPVTFVDGVRLRQSSSTGNTPVSETAGAENTTTTESLASNAKSSDAASIDPSELVDDEADMEMAETQEGAVANRADESSAPIIQRPRHRVAAWSVGAELGASGSLLTNGNSDWGMGFYAGVPVEFAFAENWAVGSGVFYSQRSSYGQTDAEETVQYGFGRRMIREEFTSAGLAFVEMPLTLIRTFGNNEIELGGYVGYKVSEWGTTTTTVESSLNPSETTEYNSIPSNSGSSDWDAGIKMGYAYRIDERWRITAQGVVGILDGFADANGDLNQHVQLRVGARYMLGL